MASPNDALVAIDQALAALPAAGMPSAPPQLLPLLRALASGPTPRAALLGLGRLAAQIEPPQHRWPESGRELAALAALLASGSELPRLLARDPARLQLLASPSLELPWDRERLARGLASRGEPATLDDLAADLAAFRNDHFVRLAAREFTGAPLEEIGGELADLADVCLEAALQRSIALRAARLGAPRREDGAAATIVAVAMGKYGARELNFCSDIDVVFFYDTDAGSAGKLSLHEFFAAVCRDVVRLLGPVGDEGLVFRVDLGLRPEGASGPICNALGSAERYYETWGGPYDRLAWLKARPAAGHLDLGERLLAALRPFVFPRHVDPQLVETIQQLSARLHAVPAGGVRPPGWDVKLGAGGIRDIELFVQALQLLHAGKQPLLQVRSTLAALERLLVAGLIDEREQRELGAAYRLLRRIEHHLQLRAGQQTHWLEQGEATRCWLAGLLGWQPPELNDELERSRRAVIEIHATLGSPVAPDERLAPLLAGDLPVAEMERVLASCGFGDGRRAARQLRRLRALPSGPLGRAAPAAARRSGLRWLDELARAPQPLAALRHFGDLCRRFGRFEGLWAMFAEHPQVIRLVCNLFGTSDLLSELLLASPELLDQLLRVLGGVAAPGDSAARAAEGAGERAPACGGDAEAQLLAIERHRGEELLRVGLLDVSGALELPQVWRQLSAVAERVIRRQLSIVAAAAGRRYGAPRHVDGSAAKLAVIGLGKLGARELGYGSDLDLIFIYSGDGKTDGACPVSNGEFFTRVAQRLIRALTTAVVRPALGYRVDTRLRPSGQQGTLVSSWEAFTDYHARAGRSLWERQALIKARAVAGDPAFGERVERWNERFLYSDAVAEGEARAEIARLRRRIEKELAAEDPDSYDLKLGRGGLLDIEFTAQFLQLRHGHALRRLRRRRTLDALAAAGEAGLIALGTAESLAEGYIFLRRLESRLQIVGGRAAERLPRDPEHLAPVARRLGYHRSGNERAADQLLRAYERTTRAIRTIYRSIIDA